MFLCVPGVNGQGRTLMLLRKKKKKEKKRKEKKRKKRGVGRISAFVRSVKKEPERGSHGIRAPVVTLRAFPCTHDSSGEIE